MPRTLSTSVFPSRGRGGPEERPIGFAALNGWNALIAVPARPVASLTRTLPPPTRSAPLFTSSTVSALNRFLDDEFRLLEVTDDPSS